MDTVSEMTEGEGWFVWGCGKAVTAGAVLLMGFYTVYMAVHLLALVFGRMWLHSKTPNKLGMRDLPGVSVIKPIVDCDPNLRTNLKSFFTLDYPKYEILFCIAESSCAPSLPVVTELISQYPAVESRVFQGGEQVGVNPKINNMMVAYRAAKYGLIWINDSSILTLPHTLTELVSHIRDPGVAIVHQLPYVASADTFAACLDKVYFGTQHSRVYLVANWLGQNCANGMSWLVRKVALEEEGGLAAFSHFLAEDFFIGKALWIRGWKLALSTLPALQNQGRRSLSAYQDRVIRWGRLRATMMPWPGLLEPLTECLGLGVVGGVCAGQLLGVNVGLFLLVHVFLWFLFDMLLLVTIEKGLSLQNGPVCPLWCVLLAWCLRELWTYPLFLAGVWSREISWKGRRFRIQWGGKAIKLD